MFHCHNLVHEEHDMMDAFNISDVDLTSYGYPENTKFGDPMMQLFRSKPYSGTDLNQIRDVLLPYFKNLDAYPNAAHVEKALDDYYKNPPKTSSSPAASTVPSTLVTSIIPATSTPLTTSTSSKTSTTSTSPATMTPCSKGNGKNTCK